MRTKRKIYQRLAAWLALCMVIGLIPITSIKAEAVSLLWSGSTADSFESGDGTEENPYMIKTAEQLAYLAVQVNIGTDYTGSYFELQNDIVLNENVLDGDGELNSGSFQPWTPIGIETYPFKGNFNGREHSIKGIYIHDDSLSGAGLFGYVNGATIDSIHIEDNYIYGKEYVGGVIGKNDGGSISNVSNSGTINGDTKAGGVVGYNIRGSISKSNNSGKVNARNSDIANYVGGIIGWNNSSGSIDNSSNSGEINGHCYKIGGVTGTNNGSISNSSNSGNINGIGDKGTAVGGVAGENDGGSISNCSNSGEVRGDGCVGGVTGDNGWNSNKTPGIISNSSNSGAVSGNKQVGGVAGNNGIAKIVSCSNSGAVDGGTGSDIVGGVVGYQSGAPNSGKITENCSNSGSVNGSGTGELNIGGLTGMQNSGTIKYCSNSGSVSGSSTSTGTVNIGGLTGYQNGGSTEFSFWREIDGISEVGTLDAGTTNNCSILDTSSINALNSFADSQGYLKWIPDAYGYPMVAISQIQLQWKAGCLDDVTYNYTETNSITYQVTNTGNTKLSNIMVNLSGDNQTDFEISGLNLTELEPNQTVEFTVSLMTDKKVGNYTANVDVSADTVIGTTINTTTLGFAQKVNKAVTDWSKVSATDETIKNLHDGTITNVTQDMEYKLGEGGTYQAVSESGVLKGLAPGTYFIRYNDNYDDTTPIQLIINEGEEGRYELKLEGDSSWSDLTYGYDQGNRVTYKVTNAGNTIASSITVNSSGDNSDDFQVSESTLSDLKPGDTVEFTMTFPVGKKAGSYVASIDVSAKNPFGNSITTNSSITQKVNMAASKLSEIGKTDETIKGFNDGSITNVTTEMEYKVGEEGTYQAITVNGTITGLSPGTYYIHYKDTYANNYDNNTLVQLIIDEGVDRKYELKLEAEGSWSDLTYGYDQGNRVTYKVTNAGNVIASNLKIDLLGDSKDDFEISTSLSPYLNPNETTEFNITFPKGKDAGNYAVSVYVYSDTTSGEAIKTNRISITQKVNKVVINKPELEKTDETIKGFNDGSIMNVTKEMEYKLGEESNYQAITVNGALTGLSPGTYYVRYKGMGNDNYYYELAILTIQAGEEGKYELELNGEGSWSDLTYGYDQGNRVTYKVTNAGNVIASNLTVDLSGDSKDDFEISTSLSPAINPNETTEFNITFPKGKDAGNYAVSVYVYSDTTSGEAIKTNRISITQKVNKVVINKPELEKTDVTIKGFNDGSIMNVTTEMEYKLGKESNYKAITVNGALTGLSPGTYYVRYKGEDNNNYYYEPAILIIKELSSNNDNNDDRDRESDTSLKNSGNIAEKNPTSLKNIKIQLDETGKLNVLGESKDTGSLDAEKEESTAFNKPIRVQIDLSNMDIKDGNNITLISYEKQADGTLKKVMLGGTYDEETHQLIAYLEKPGNYEIAEEEGLVKLVLKIGDIKSTVNNNEIINDVAPKIINNHTMVPIRFIAENLGAEVKWNSEKKEATITLDGKELKLKLGEVLEGSDIKVIIENNRLLVPLRYISESLGAYVLWVPDDNHIEIIKQKR